MHTAKQSLILGLLISLSIVSCTRSMEVSYPTGMGGVRLELSTDLPATKADVTSLDVDDFKIEVINSKDVIFKRWNTYADFKEDITDGLIQMNAGGPYRIRATYGDSTASGFDAFFFMGEQEFTVIPQQEVKVSVVCRMANVKVAVKYGEHIKADYVDYTATVSNTAGSLSFSKECTESGYLPAEDLTVDMVLVDETGKEWYFRKPEKVAVEPGDFVTLNLDTKEVPEEGVEITITIDTSTEDHTVTVSVPGVMLPADPPAVSTRGFDLSTGIYSAVEGTVPSSSLDVSFSAMSRIKSLVMNINSATLEALGWPERVDFADMDVSTTNLMKSAGLVFTENPKGEKMASVDFTSMFKLFKYSDIEAENTHLFEFVVTDTLDKSVTASCTIVPVMASKSLSEIATGDIWARRITVTATTDGNPDLLFPEVMASGDLIYSRPSYTKSLSGQNATFVITGLKPSTEYTIRAAYNNYSSEQVITAVTENASQVSNAGMEDWTEREVVAYSIFGSKTYQKTYDPWSTGEKWWDTNNSQTTAQATTPSNLTFKCFPMVTYTAGRTGARAAQIMAIAVNNGNTSGTSLSDATPGKLFIGTYGGSTNHSFDARPSQLKFYYKYAPNGTDTFRAYIAVYSGDTQIAAGEFTNSSSVGEWTEAVADLEYSNTSLKATAIFIEFRQSVSDTPPYSKNKTITYPAGSANVHGGSILSVDDIELIYE